MNVRRGKLKCSSGQRSYAEAYQWYDLAGPDAVSDRNRVAQQLTPDQLTRAQQSVKDWKAGAGDVKAKLRLNIWK